MADQPPTAPASIHAPWRMEYLESLGTAEKSAGPPKSSSGSFLRDYWLAPQDDEKNHVIVRTGKGFICLNAYPYANGHLLVALGEGRARLLDYEPADRASLWQLTELATDLMELTLEPQGINVGINQGRAAGAGVPQHIHVHLVPRWGGDVNFMATVGNVRVIPGSLEAMAGRYRDVWKKMTS
jgi:ATP adenylyltransferase